MESIHVKLRYGPYRAHGIIRHKKQRLHGLIELLNQKNYTLELIPSPHLNRLTIDMMEREIFSCDIRYFLFNLPGDWDPMCKKALLAIQEHAKLFYTAENRPKFSDIKEGMKMMLKRDQSASFIADLDYHLQIPQNSQMSLKDWSCGELSDPCTNYRYTMYTLGSADLFLDTHDSDGKQEDISLTTTSSKSGLLDDYWFCDDNMCYPTCPPASLVQGEISSCDILTEENLELENIVKVSEDNESVRIIDDDALPVNQ